jgi:hypothetical protein
MSLAARKDDPEVEVRREDQEQINEFGRLNNRLIEIREDKSILKVRQHHCKTSRRADMYRRNSIMMSRNNWRSSMTR